MIGVATTSVATTALVADRRLRSVRLKSRPPMYGANDRNVRGVASARDTV